MAFLVTNHGGAYSSSSLSLAAGASVVMNVATLPADLSPALVSRQLTAADLNSPPLFVYSIHGFTSTALGSGLQYLPMQGSNVVPSSSANQIIYPNGAKRLYNMQIVLATPPGTGNSRTFTVIKDGAAQLLTLTFGPAESGRKRISLLIDVLDMQALEIKSDVSGTPAASQVVWSFALSDAESNI